MKSEGDSVRINSKEFILGEKIGGGTEGSVFNIAKGPDSKDYSGYVIKIINDSKFGQEKIIDVNNRLTTLKNIGDANKNLRQRMTLPKALLMDDLGYVMVKANDYESLENYLYCPEDSENWYRSEYTLKKRYQIIYNIFDALRVVHLSGLIFTDLSPKNIMVHKNKNGIVFIDTDNLRKKNDRCPGVIGTPSYIAPEIYRKKIPEKLCGTTIKTEVKNMFSHYGCITVESDIFSAAVIAFELLTLHHPFIGDLIDESEPEEEEKARRIETDYIFKKGTENTSTKGLTTKIDSLVTPEIKKLFERTFVEGKDNPLLRPTDKDFIEAFQKAIGHIIECPNGCGYSSIYNLNKENRCMMCDKTIEKQIIMTCFTTFDGMSYAEGLNEIGKDQYLNITDIMIKKENERKECVLSTMVLPKGETRKLYGWGIEKIEGREKCISNITLSKTSDKIEFRVVPEYQEARLFKTESNRAIRKISEGLEFDCTNHWIQMEKIKHGKGSMITCIKFTRQ